MFTRYLSANGDASLIASAVAAQIQHCMERYDSDPAVMTVRVSAVARRGGFTATDVHEFAARLALGEPEETKWAERFGFTTNRTNKSGELRFAPIPEAWTSGDAA